MCNFRFAGTARLQPPHRPPGETGTRNGDLLTIPTDPDSLITLMVFLLWMLNGSVSS